MVHIGNIIAILVLFGVLTYVIIPSKANCSKQNIDYYAEGYHED